VYNAKKQVYTCICFDYLVILELYGLKYPVACGQPPPPAYSKKTDMKGFWPVYKDTED